MTPEKVLKNFEAHNEGALAEVITTIWSVHDATTMPELRYKIEEASQRHAITEQASQAAYQEYHRGLDVIEWGRLSDEVKTRWRRAAQAAIAAYQIFKK